MSVASLIPTQLRKVPQWVNWQEGKIPSDRNGRKINALDSKNWLPYEEALKVSSKIGFVLTESDAFICVDFDNCVEDRKITCPKVDAYCKQLNSYTEISQSGKGLHIFITGQKPGSRDRVKGVEIYDKNRFIAVTGDLFGKKKRIKPRTKELSKVYRSVFEPSRSKEIIKKIRLSRDADNFSWLHDEGTGNSSDQSANDQIYFNLLAKHTRDLELIKEIAFESKLVREKWSRNDYIERTIASALNYVGASSEVLASDFFVFDFHKQPVKAVEWLIDEHLQTSTIATLIGETGCGKSFLAIDFALSIASGASWQGYEVKQGGVLYICGEGNAGIRVRMAAWESERNISDHSNFAVSTGPAFLLDATCLESLRANIEIAKQKLDVINLIVVDTLNTNWGNGNENEARDMTNFVNACKELQNETGACVLIVHHTGHGKADRGRGSSVLKAAVDTEMLLYKKNDSLMLELSKQKDGHCIPKQSYKLKVVGLDNGETSCVVDSDTEFEEFIDEYTVLEKVIICILNGKRYHKGSADRQWLVKRFGGSNVSKAIRKYESEEFDGSRLKLIILEDTL